jgi:hypothetical protein
MFRNRKPFQADLIVFVVCCLLATWFFGYEVGVYRTKQIPLVCAKVLGLTPVSSDATTCTYIMGTQGRAYWKYLAKQEEKK